MLTVIGTIALDLFLRGVDNLPERAEDEFSNASLAWLNRPVQATLGGNGGNTAYVAAGLGESVRLGGAVGADPFGDLVLSWLHARGVDLSGTLVLRDAATPTTVVISDTRLRRHTYHHPGASEAFGPADFELAAGTSGWLLLSGYSLLPRWRGPGSGALLRRAREAGVGTALDFGPALGQPVTASELAEMLPHVDLLLCNCFELEQATGMDMARGAAWALGSGVGAVVVKLGAEGASLFNAAGPEGVTVPAFPVEAVGTVGAGDAFDAGLLFALGRGASLYDAVRFGAQRARRAGRGGRAGLHGGDAG
jgi:ribokinase